MNIINPYKPSHALTTLMELLFYTLSQIKKIMSISEYTIPKLYLLWLTKWQAEISIIKSNTYCLAKTGRTFSKSLQRPKLLIPHRIGVLPAVKLFHRENISPITGTDLEFFGYSPLTFK